MPAMLSMEGLARRRTRVDAKWVKHFRVLLALRERLLREMVDLLEQGSQSLGPQRREMADSAADDFDNEIVLSRLSAVQNALFEVDEALERVLSGHYGVCEQTGRPIDEARLTVAPWTRFAKDIEERWETSVSGLNPGRVGLAPRPLGGDDEMFEGNDEEANGGTVASDETLQWVELSFARSNRDLAVARRRCRLHYR